MSRLRSALTVLLFVVIFVVGREGQAVIYKYVTDKGIPTYADDMQKVPEQYRAQAVVVSGGNDYDAYAEQEKARLAAEARTRQQVSGPVKAAEPFSSRLIRSGIAVGLFVALLLVISNIHGLREQAQLLFRIRIVLVLLLVIFLGFTHAKDVAGLFGKVGEKVWNPIADIQERSAQRGKRAAEAYKALDRALDQRSQEEEAMLKERDQKFSDAERAK